MSSASVTSPAKKPFVWKPTPVNDRRPALRLTTGSHRWDVRLVGLTSRSRLLVTHPMTDGKLVFVKEGERFDVGNFDGTVLSAFESTVLRVLLGESAALEMSLPAPELRRREVIRKARRARVVLPCSVRYGVEADALRAGFTVDLSEQGAQVAIERPLPEGVETVDLSLRVPVLGAPVTVLVRGRIRASVPDPRPDVNATLLGLQFEDFDPVLQLAVSQFVGERLLSEGDDVFGIIR
jgi:c-di-GMP-binding flagellar brake protein YcgR